MNMKILPKFLTAMLILIFTGTVLLAAPGPDAWLRPKVENGTVELSAVGDLLEIKYNLMPTLPVLYGNRTRFINEVDLMLKNPIPLGEDTEKITFEAKGLVIDGKGVVNAMMLKPIVRDINGELFYFMPRFGSDLKHTKGSWSKFTTAGFFSGEAGAAAQDIYTTGGTPDNSRPDGKLELVGFRLLVTRSTSALEAGKGNYPKKYVTGSLYLGEIKPESFKLSFAYPYAYADAFLKEKGDYVFAVEARNEFQGTPVREFRKEIKFDHADPISAKQRFEFELGPDDHYWINYQVTKKSGEAVVDGFMKQQVIGNPDKTPLQSVSLTQAPSIGYMRINPGNPQRGVYKKGQPFDLDIRVFPQGKKKLKLQYTLQPYFCKDVLKSGEKELDFKADSPQDIVLKFDDDKRFSAFRLEIKLIEAGKVIDKQDYIFGRESDLTAQHKRAGQKTDRREIKKAPYNRLTYLCEGAKTGSLAYDYLVKDFRDYLANTGEFVQHHTYMVDLNDFEVLPGVYDFSLLDEIMDAAADYGCKVTVRFAHADQHSGPYRWGKYSRQIAADGSIINLQPYGVYEVTDPALNDLWLDAYRALFDRYKEHTAFEGYYVMLPAGEWVVVDQPWAGNLSGYSPVALNAFHDYLQKSLGLSIADLNKRWGTSYKSFEEVKAPLPTFRDGMKPDLRMAWLDFCRFKAGLGKNFWLPKAVNNIREYDNDRITIVYGYPSAYPELYGKLDYGHNGGNHRLDHVAEFEDAWLKGGIGWITEPIHPHGWAATNDPGRDGWVLDVSFWTMISQAGGGGANLHVYYFSKNDMEILPHQGAFYAQDRYARFKPMLREMQQAKLVPQIAEIAVQQDMETLYSKHRTTFGARLADLRQWFGLLDDDGVPYAQLDAFPDAKFKLLVPNIIDEVISEKTMQRYVKMVKEDGARIIISANTGKYVPELGDEKFQLLKAFGIPVPQKDYITNGDIAAKAIAGNPLFDDGTKIEFQTVSRMREQLKSKEVIANFWQYPYRWIPETNYFGYYPAQEPGGKVLARFADGGAAMSVHKAGKGEVLVFWGTPDISGHKLKGMMKRASEWAKVNNPLADAEISRFTELTNKKLNRHYGLFYNEDKFGKFKVKFPNCPDGDFFCDEMICDFKIGHYSGKDLREKGLELEWVKGASPLKLVRILPANKVPKSWVDSFNKK